MIVHYLLAQYTLKWRARTQRWTVQWVWGMRVICCLGADRGRDSRLLSLMLSAIRFQDQS